MPDFWTNHGVFFLLCLACFPRLTLLLSNIVSGGVLWWVGWVFAPHLLVAILSIPFWDSNPVLVLFAFVIALGGSTVEGETARRGAQ